jgi:hypothetical protein
MQDCVTRFIKVVSELAAQELQYRAINLLRKHRATNIPKNGMSPGSGT